MPRKNDPPVSADDLWNAICRLETVHPDAEDADACKRVARWLMVREADLRLGKSRGPKSPI